MACRTCRLAIGIVIGIAIELLDRREERR